MPDLNDEFKHHSNESLNQPEDRPHAVDQDCWCQPVRERFNSLTQRWEMWDKQSFQWIAADESQIKPGVGVSRMSLDDALDMVVPPIAPQAMPDDMGDRTTNT